MAKILVLGSGTPTPTPTRFGTAFIVQIGEEYVMFDCGPATTYKMAKIGVFPTQVNHLFFTHHHYDHDADYPCFLLCRWNHSIGIESELQVCGPPPTSKMTNGLIGQNGVFIDDLSARINAPASQKVHVNRGGTLPRPQISIKVRDIGPGDNVKGNHWKVVAGSAKHVEPWLISLAYRIDTEDEVIVIAGDTEPCESVMELSKGADVFVANCWDHQETMDRNGEAPGQTGTIDAANMAKESGAKTLILAHTGTHLSAAGSREKGVADIARIYDGKVIFAEELMNIAV